MISCWSFYLRDWCVVVGSQGMSLQNQCTATGRQGVESLQFIKTSCPLVRYSGQTGAWNIIFRAGPEKWHLALTEARNLFHSPQFKKKRQFFSVQKNITCIQISTNNCVKRVLNSSELGILMSRTDFHSNLEKYFCKNCYPAYLLAGNSGTICIHCMVQKSLMTFFIFSIAIFFLQKAMLVHSVHANNLISQLRINFILFQTVPLIVPI